MTTPRVWIGCLAAYNEGTLHGEWFDAAVDDDDLWAAKDKVIASSPAWHPEEWFIADYEGFAPYRVGEYDSLATVAMVARLIEEHGAAFAAWLSNDDSVLHYKNAEGHHQTADEDELVEAFGEAFRGEWDSEEEYARNLVGEIGLPGVGFVWPETATSFSFPVERRPWGEVLDGLDSILDWETITRTMMEDCWTHEEGGKTLVFESR